MGFPKVDFPRSYYSRWHPSIPGGMIFIQISLHTGERSIARVMFEKKKPVNGEKKNFLSCKSKAEPFFIYLKKMGFLSKTQFSKNSVKFISSHITGARARIF